MELLASLFFLVILSPNGIYCLYDSSYDSQNLTTANLIEILFVNYSDRVRPDVDLRKPTDLQLNIYINSISSVNEITMDLTMNIFLRQKWRDHRLQFPNKYGVISLNPKDVPRLWYADLYFPTEKDSRSHKITVPNVLVFLSPDGSVYFSQRLTIISGCNMKLNFFPFDVQSCKIKVETYAMRTTDLLLAWYGKQHVELDPDIMLPEFSLNKSIQTFNCTKTYISGTYPCLSFELRLSRMIGYFLIQNYIPSILIVILSWVSFWIDIHAVPARISLGLLTVLTMTTQISGIHSRLPRVSYIKAIDVWLTSCMVFVFGALIEFSIVNVLARQDQKKQAQVIKRQKHQEVTNLRSIVEEVMKDGTRRTNGSVFPTETASTDRSSENGINEDIDEGGSALLADKISRLIFPLSYILFNLVYWCVYMVGVQK